VLIEIRTIIYLVILFILLVWMYHENNKVTIKHINIKSQKLPREFNGHKILHISDLHSKIFDIKHKKLIKSIKKEKPDLIVISGDLIDRRIYKEEASIDLLKYIVKIYPTYFVTGNHEVKSDKFDLFEPKLKELGVRVLKSDKVEININGDKINVFGIDDYSNFKSEKEYIKELKLLANKLDNKLFNILLSHRPDKFKTYCYFNFDLIFSGHAHGGQVRLPLIGGIFAPNQGLFPRYTDGVYKSGKSTMIVSRGLGNTSVAPIRIFNKPEVVVVTLVK